MLICSKHEWRSTFDNRCPYCMQEEISSLQDKLYHESRKVAEVEFIYSVFIERMKQLSQAMPPNAISMNIQKALKSLELE